MSAHLLHRDIKSVHTNLILSVANGEEVSSVRPEAGALGFIQQALKTGTMENVSRHLWISKHPVRTCLWEEKWDFYSGEFSVCLF